MKSEQKISDDDVPDAVKLEVAILSPPERAPAPGQATRDAGRATAFIRVIGAEARCAFVAHCLAPWYRVDVRPDFAQPSAGTGAIPAIVVCPPDLFDEPPSPVAAPVEAPIVLLIPDQDELDRLVHRRALPPYAHVLVWPFTEQVLRTRIRSLLSENTLPE